MCRECEQQYSTYIGIIGTDRDLDSELRKGWYKDSSKRPVYPKYESMRSRVYNMIRGECKHD